MASTATDMVMEVEIDTLLEVASETKPTEKVREHRRWGRRWGWRSGNGGGPCGGNGGGDGSEEILFTELRIATRHLRWCASGGSLRWWREKRTRGGKRHDASRTVLVMVLIPFMEKVLEKVEDIGGMLPSDGPNIKETFEMEVVFVLEGGDGIVSSEGIGVHQRISRVVVKAESFKLRWMIFLSWRRQEKVIVSNESVLVGEEFQVTWWRRPGPDLSS